MQSYQAVMGEGVPQDYVTSHVPRLRPICVQPVLRYPLRFVL